MAKYGEQEITYEHIFKSRCESKQHSNPYRRCLRRQDLPAISLYEGWDAEADGTDDWGGVCVKDNGDEGQRASEGSNLGHCGTGALPCHDRSVHAQFAHVDTVTTERRSEPWWSTMSQSAAHSRASPGGSKTCGLLPSLTWWLFLLGIRWTFVPPTRLRAKLRGLKGKGYLMSWGCCLKRLQPRATSMWRQLSSRLCKVCDCIHHSRL